TLYRSALACGRTSCPTRRSSDLRASGTRKSARVSRALLEQNSGMACAPSLSAASGGAALHDGIITLHPLCGAHLVSQGRVQTPRSEEHTSELQSRENLVCRLLLE